MFEDQGGLDVEHLGKTREAGDRDTAEMIRVLDDDMAEEIVRSRQMENAVKVAEFLSDHPKVVKVSYLGLLTPQDDGYRIYKEQCEGPGAMISMWVDGGEEEAFRFLDSLQLAQLAVSLGSTESLVQHPASMTHAGVDPDDKVRLDVTDSLVRLSVGVENPDDIIADLANALKSI